MQYLQESGAAIHRRHRRQRAVITLTIVTLLMFGTFVYAAAYVQGWVGTGAPQPVATATCQKATPTKPVTPGSVTINVYNTTARSGLAATVAKSLRNQGFKVGAVDNDPLGTSIQGVGEIRHGPAGNPGTLLAATRLPGARIVQDNRTDVTVDVVLGNKFTALSTPSTVARPSVAKPAPRC